MILRILWIMTILLTGFVVPETTSAAARTLTRQEIRAMPIEKRPNRIGHFYGNTVRRRHHR